ncbi:cytokine receptor common subunit beta [Eleutherodactylus coqui]|uniref:cytokine receptor common subunit beta n=1 Tax=Eleutherodactylus coqui TaxID=57060 RepID=UPI0034637CDD
MKMGAQGLFVLLCILQYVRGMQGSALLDSLICVNNYETRWRCQWKLSAEAHKLLPMNLIHWSGVTSRGSQLCEPDDSGKIKDGEVYLTCQFNDRFTFSMITSYSFQAKRNVSKNTYIIPNSKIRLPPPEGLMVQKSGLKNDSITLRWRMPDNISNSRHLLFQVTYCRKDWESWEDAAVLIVMGKTEVSFSPHLFVPGSTYLFRVRSVPDKDHLYRSVWSNNVAWTMPEEEDPALPLNLRCEYDGFTQMKCSWEVRKELSAMSYMLYYKDGTAYGTAKTSIHGEKPCNSPSSQMIDGTPYVLYSCTFQVPSSQANSSFHIQVRPEEELKKFNASKTVQTDPPTDLHIKDQLNYKYKFGWRPPAVPYNTIKLTYQLCYWKEGDEEYPDLLLINVSGNVAEYYIPSSKLMSSTNYTVKVRAKPDNSSGYNGPWSEWSQSFSWKTDKGVDRVAISIAIFIASVGFLLCIYLGFVCLKRLKQQWENSIPDPGKSKLSKFPLGYQDPNFPQFISQEFYTEMERPLVTLQISPIKSPQSTCDVSEEFVVEIPSNPSASPLGPYSMSPPTAEKVQNHQASCKLPGIVETHDLKGASLPQPTGHSAKMGHKSPYFIFTQAQSMSDFIAKESKLSDYFMLPKCKSNVFSAPQEFIPTCQAIPIGSQMSYVLNMEKRPPLQTPLKDNDNKYESKKSSYFTIPSPADVQVPQEGPLMIINPDGTGPIVLKQVGEYCFFPGIHGSQENLERKIATANVKMNPQMPKDAPIPVVQAFKVMQRDYLALPQN